MYRACIQYQNYDWHRQFQLVEKQTLRGKVGDPSYCFTLKCPQGGPGWNLEPHNANLPGCQGLKLNDHWHLCEHTVAETWSQEQSQDFNSELLTTMPTPIPNHWIYCFRLSQHSIRHILSVHPVNYFLVTLYNLFTSFSDNEQY